MKLRSVVAMAFAVAGLAGGICSAAAPSQGLYTFELRPSIGVITQPVTDQWVLNHLSAENATERVHAIKQAGFRGLEDAIPALREQLNREEVDQADRITRLEAAVSLWTMGDGSGEPLLRQIMRAREMFRMFDAVKPLAARGDEEAIKMARDYLRAGYPHERRDALEALAGAPQSEDDLYKLLEQGLKDSGTMAAAARLLAEKKSPQAARLLASADSGDLGVMDRYTVVRALADVGRWSAVPALVRALEDPDPFVHKAAAHHLMNIPRIPHPWRAEKDGLAPSTAMQPVEQAPGPGDLELYGRLKEDPDSRKLYARLLLEWWDQNKTLFDLDAEVPKPKEAAKGFLSDCIRIGPQRPQGERDG